MPDAGRHGRLAEAGLLNSKIVEGPVDRVNFNTGVGFLTLLLQPLAFP